MDVPDISSVARPGDTVIMTMRDRLSDEELSEFIEQFEGFFDRTGVHLAIVEGVQQMVIVRPGEDVEGIDDWGDGDIRNDPTYRPCKCGCRGEGDGGQPGNPV